MERNYKIVLILILLALAAGVYRLPQRRLTEVEALTMVVETAGAAVTEGEVQYFVVLNNQFQELDELERVLQEVTALLGMENCRAERSAGETFRVVDTTGKTAFGPAAHVVVQSNPGDDHKLPPQTYLLVVCRDTTAAALAAAVEQLTAALQPYAPGGQLSYYLSGQLDARKNGQELEYMAKKALAAVRGTIVEGMQDEQLVSYTAYTPLLERYVTVDGGRFNVNVAVRYDDYLQKTVVWAGFPLIHDSY